MARKLSAGPTPDGSFISRRTDNAYSHAVAIVEPDELTRYIQTGENGSYEYELVREPNPAAGQWKSYSWHSRYDLAVKSLDKARSHGYRGVIVPTVDA